MDFNEVLLQSVGMSAIISLLLFFFWRPVKWSMQQQFLSDFETLPLKAALPFYVYIFLGLATVVFLYLAVENLNPPEFVMGGMFLIAFFWCTARYRKIFELV